jgi:hypothetical protein
MSAAAPLRLVDDDGVDHRTARLERDLASAKRMLQVAYEEMKVKDDTIKKYHRENTSLKGRLLRQEHQDAQDELVNAVFEFWKLMTVHPRAKLGADRVKAVNARVREGATPADFFKAIVGAAYDSFVETDPKEGHDVHQEEAKLNGRPDQRGAAVRVPSADQAMLHVQGDALARGVPPHLRPTLPPLQ